MKKKQVDLYYFSGTGNTLLVAKEIKQILENNAVPVNLYRIEETDPATVKTDKTMGLVFPVAFQSTFPFLWDFFKALPEANGTEIFMLDTMMSFSGAIVGPLKKILQNKGYHCIGAREIIMPNNYLVSKINPLKNKLKIKKSLIAVHRFGLMLIQGKTTWQRIPVLSDIMHAMCCNDSMTKNVVKALGKKITLDSDQCTRCGLCQRLCPVNNIKMTPLPEWNDQCQSCMRCLNFCPVQAISVKNKKFVPYRAVNANELLKDQPRPNQ